MAKAASADCEQRRSCGYRAATVDTAEGPAPSCDADYFGIEVRKHLLKRFPTEQWKLLDNITLRG